MQLPDYVTLEEVRRVCKELNIRDWTALAEATVLPEEAGVILAEANVGGMDVPLDDFRKGLEVELEHGLGLKHTNVTNNHPILTGRIVLAHFEESLDYYKRLEVAELEGDLLKATIAADTEKVQALYGRLLKARLILSQAEAEQLT